MNSNEMESHNTTPMTPFTEPSEDSQSASVVHLAMTQEELEAPLLSLEPQRTLTSKPWKPLIEMTDPELVEFHSWHRKHRLSQQELKAHLAGSAPAVKEESVKSKKAKEIEELYQW